MKLFVGAKGVIVHEGKVLLLRESSEYLDGTETGKWDVPGGRIEPEEEVAQGLLREVKEESGLEVVAGKALGIFDGFPEIRGEKCHIVRAYFECAVKGEVDVSLSEDHDEYRWVSGEELDGLDLMSDVDEVVRLALNFSK